MLQYPGSSAPVLAGACELRRMQTSVPEGVFKSGEFSILGILPPLRPL